jgi:hypothetical protein
MSFLLPALRQSFRNHLRNNATILRQQNALRLTPLHRVSAGLRPYTNSKNQGQNPPSQRSQKSDPSTDSKNDPLEEFVSSKTKSPEDLPTGDMHAAPGSFLSQYTGSPQPQAGDVGTTEGGTGSHPNLGEYISSTDRKRERMARIGMYGFLFGLVGGGIYLGRPLETEERERIGWGDVPLI